MIEIIPNWHPFFVHFTVALLTLSTIFYALALIGRTSRLSRQWLTFGQWNLWLGVAFSLLTIGAGWYAYNTVTHDTPSHAAMTDHRNWALGTIAVFGALAAWACYQHRQKTAPSLFFIVLLFAGLLLLMSTAWRGAELVYRYGLGVQSLPHVNSQGTTSDGHGHNHDSLDAGQETNAEHSNNAVGRDSPVTGEHSMPSANHDDGHDHAH